MRQTMIFEWEKNWNKRDEDNLKHSIDLMKKSLKKNQKRKLMNIGTKSLLFGAHQFVIHPIFVLIAWIKLYGFPWDFRIWIAIIIHDWGYWGKPNMDGKEGDTHPLFAAKIMYKLFGWKWHDFCLYHSRYYAKKDNSIPSKLCMADKFSNYYINGKLYLFLVNLTGEIKEYMDLSKKREGSSEQINKYESMNLNSEDQVLWFKGVQSYLYRWVMKHKDCDKSDTWTPEL
jgi:hypothetical protein